MIAQAQIRLHAKYDSTPMRSFTHQWNLSRSFGRQPVVCASSPSWPEAGIATRIIPAQSSRWTLHGQGDVFCRPADLPTCRFWSLVTTGAPLAHSLQATAQAFPGHPQALVSSLQAPATVQRPVPVLALGTIRHPSSPPLSLETARHQEKNKNKMKILIALSFCALSISNAMAYVYCGPVQNPCSKNPTKTITWHCNDGQTCGPAVCVEICSRASGATCRVNTGYVNVSIPMGGCGQ